MPFDRNDLLDQAGYEKGDTITLASLGNSAKLNESTTSTSFTFALGLLTLRIRWGDFDVVPDRARLSGFINNGAGETGTVEAFNSSDSETIRSFQSTQNGGSEPFDTGWADYTPTDITKVTTVRARIRTDPGTNSTNVEAVLLLLGKQL